MVAEEASECGGQRFPLVSVSWDGESGTDTGRGRVAPFAVLGVYWTTCAFPVGEIVRWGYFSVGV
jgi:hypothetical protein